MQHCPLKLFAAGWQLNCCQYPLRASPVVCTSVAFPELSKYPGGNLTWSVSEAVAVTDACSFPEPGLRLARRGAKQGGRSPSTRMQFWNGEQSVQKNKRRTLVFNVGNGQYVMKVTEKHPNGGKELGGRAGGLCALCTALTYPFSALQQSTTSFYDALK